MFSKPSTNADLFSRLAAGTSAANLSLREAFYELLQISRNKAATSTPAEIWDRGGEIMALLGSETPVAFSIDDSDGSFRQLEFLDDNPVMDEIAEEIENSIKS